MNLACLAAVLGLALSPPPDTTLVTEGLVKAPVERVFADFTTKEGMESYNVAKAEVDLRVGGRMRSHYSRDGVIGDENTIVNVILAYDPNRMLCIQVEKPPARFPYREAIKRVWTVLYFESKGPEETRLTIRMLGFGEDEESKKCREFFKAGNASVLQSLQKKYDKSVP
jgi:uncharacterized protein YndB with AHSA1/START domain